MPVRIQRKRSKGWRMPAGAAYVGRPTKYGNPWSVEGYFDAGYSGTTLEAAKACVENFRAWMTRTRSSWTGDVPGGPLKHPDGSVRFEPQDVSALRGKDLACWCPLDQPCHADVLLAIANQPLTTVYTLEQHGKAIQALDAAIDGQAKKNGSLPPSGVEP